MSEAGLVYVFTGEGKGKTSAALGVAIRCLLIKKRVVWVAFYKQSAWGLAESKLTEKFVNMEMVFVGRGFRIVKPEQVKGNVKLASVGKGAKVVDTASESEHKEAARKGLEVAGQFLQRTELCKEGPFLLVMDEVLNAISEGLVKSEQVVQLLNKRGGTHIILTGRGACEEIIAQADLVTECKKIKHPYDRGKLAVAGLDY